MATHGSPQHASLVPKRTASAQEVVCLAFSPDNRLLAAQGGAPEWNLVIWNWEKAKVAGMLRTCNATGAPVHQARKRPWSLQQKQSVQGHGLPACWAVSAP